MTVALFVAFGALGVVLPALWMAIVEWVGSRPLPADWILHLPVDSGRSPEAERG